MGDRIMVVVAWLLFVYALVLAPRHQTWAAAWIIGLPAALVPTLLAWPQPGGVVVRIAVGAAFMVLSALHIHQMHGLIEMHFGIFVLLAFLVYFRDWTPIVTGAAIIAVHHLGFNFLQVGGYPVYVFEHNAGLRIALLHAAYVVFESAILIFLAEKLRREAVETEEVYATVGGLLSGAERSRTSRIYLPMRSTLRMLLKRSTRQRRKASRPCST